MSFWIRPALLTLFISFHALLAHAASFTIGAEAASTGMAQLFASPPVPSLDGGASSVTPQVGWITVQGSSFVAPTGTRLDFSGEVKGGFAGLSLTVPTKGDLGFFFFGLGTSLSGEMVSQENGQHDYTIKDITAEGFAVAGGVSYRLLGDEKSVFALGVFGGPAVMKMKSSSKLIPQPIAGINPSEISLDTVAYGPYLGVQTVLRIGSLRINPYIDIMADLSDVCRELTVSGEMTPSNFRCTDGRTGRIDAPSSMGGYGLILGYGGLRFNVYATGFSAYQYLVPKSYSASVAISF